MSPPQLEPRRKRNYWLISFSHCRSHPLLWILHGLSHGSSCPHDFGFTPLHCLFHPNFGRANQTCCFYSTHPIRSHVCWLQSTALSALSMSQFSTILSYEKNPSQNHGWAHMSIMPSLNFAGSRVEQMRAPKGARSAPLNIPCATGHQPNAMPFLGRFQKWRGVIHGDS